MTRARRASGAVDEAQGGAPRSPGPRGRRPGRARIGGSRRRALPAPPPRSPCAQAGPTRGGPGSSGRQRGRQFITTGRSRTRNRRTTSSASGSVTAVSAAASAIQRRSRPIEVRLERPGQMGEPAGLDVEVGDVVDEPAAGSMGGLADDRQRHERLGAVDVGRGRGDDGSGPRPNAPSIGEDLGRPAQRRANPLEDPTTAWRKRGRVPDRDRSTRESRTRTRPRRQEKAPEIRRSMSGRRTRMPPSSVSSAGRPGPRWATTATRWPSAARARRRARASGSRIRSVFTVTKHTVRLRLIGGRPPSSIRRVEGHDPAGAPVTVAGRGTSRSVSSSRTWAYRRSQTGQTSAWSIAYFSRSAGAGCPVEFGEPSTAHARPPDTAGRIAGDDRMARDVVGHDRPCTDHRRRADVARPDDHRRGADGRTRRQVDGARLPVAGTKRLPCQVEARGRR